MSAAMFVKKHSARAIAWRLLSAAFQYPENNWDKRMRYLLEETRAAKALPAESLNALAGAMGSSVENLDEAHFRLFGAPAATPYEMSVYLSDSPFEQVRKVADLAGFYKAFGVESEQRSDLLPAVLEFAALLELKIENAMEKKWAGKEEITQVALGKLVKTFITPAMEKFIQKLNERQAPEFYVLAAKAIQWIGGKK